MRAIGKDKRTVYIISAPLLAFLVLLLFMPVSGTAGRMISAFLLAVAAVLSWCLIKKRSILSINKRYVLMIVSVISLVYLMGYYLLGLYFGYARNAYALSGSVFLRFFIPITVIIVSSEVVRAVMLAQNDRAAGVMSYMSCVIAEVLFLYNLNSITTLNNFMDLVGLTFFPAIISNLLYHYVSKRYGMLPNIVYRCVTTLYIYVITIVPRVPDSLFALIKLLFPLAVCVFIDALYERKRTHTSAKKSKWNFLWVGIFTVITVSLVMLISCRFKYGMIVVGSGSMSGEINMGDAVIYERYDDQTITEGQVIVFEKDKSKVIHRVVKIEIINGVTRYYTKGDANESEDSGYITDADIIGLTDWKIPYIGYPTIWINGLFS